MQREISQEQYNELSSMLDTAKALELRSQANSLTLKEKLELQRTAKFIRSEAAQIGR